VSVPQPGRPQGCLQARRCPSVGALRTSHADVSLGQKLTAWVAAAGAEASTSLLALSQCLHTACRLMARELDGTVEVVSVSGTQHTGRSGLYAFPIKQ